MRVELVKSDGAEGKSQCIGYSDTAAHVFNPGQPNLAAVQEKIFGQNLAAAEEWKSSSRKLPYVTLVYLGALTGQDTWSGEESYVSEREELEGLAVAQRALLNRSATTHSAPILRIVVANGGYQIRHAKIAAEMIGELTHDDPTVVGVLGLVESRQSTADALKVLNRIGLPVIATTLSADGFYNNSKLYLQMSAANDVQASMIARYVIEVLEADKVRVYYTTGDDSSLKEDLYVKTLADALNRHLGSRLKGVPLKWRGLSGGDCRDPLVFAGRWSDFEDFLSEVGGCANTPYVIADDSVNRYMANHQLRANAPQHIPVAFVSKGSLASCRELNQSPDGEMFLRHARKTRLFNVSRCATASGPSVGERVSLAYDAAMMVVQAVKTLSGRIRGELELPWDPRLINPLAVHTEILRHAQNGFSA